MLQKNRAACAWAKAHPGSSAPGVKKTVVPKAPPMIPKQSLGGAPNVYFTIVLTHLCVTWFKVQVLAASASSITMLVHDTWLKV